MTALFGRSEFAELVARKKTGNFELLGRFKIDGTIGVTRDSSTAETNSPNLSTIKKTGNFWLLGRFKIDGTVGVTRDAFTAEVNSPNLSTIKKTGNFELLAF